MKKTLYRQRSRQAEVATWAVTFETSEASVGVKWVLHIWHNISSHAWMTGLAKGWRKTMFSWTVDRTSGQPSNVEW